MKTFTRWLFVLVASAVLGRAEFPSLVADGFDAYKSAGSKGALSVWLKGARTSPQINTAGLPPDLGPGDDSPDAYGPLESYDVIATFNLSPRLRRIFVAAYFPQGPLFCCFDLYRVSGAWTTYALKFNLSPEQILPADLLEKSG